MSEKALTLLCVKTDKGCFISKDASKTRGYDYSNLANYFFDGKKPTDTYASGWYYIEKYPTSVQCEKSGDVINARYELTDETFESDKMPKIIPYEERDNYNGDIFGLYEYKYDLAPKLF